jgi:hypothetical protein
MAKKKPSPKKPRHRTARPDLSAREVRFCAAYVEHGNATKAVIDAEIPTAGRNSAGVLAFALLRKPKIRALIRRMQEEAAAAAQLTVNRHLAHLANKAYGDRTAIFDAKGKMRPVHLWPEELRALVAGYDLDPSGRVKVRFHGGAEADRLIAQHLGMISRDATAGPAPPAIVVEGDSPQ